MKNFEKILKDELVYLVDEKINHLQFAYQAGKSVEDGKLFILNRVYWHLEKHKSARKQTTNLCPSFLLLSDF